MNQNNISQAQGCQVCETKISQCDFLHWVAEFSTEFLSLGGVLGEFEHPNSPHGIGNQPTAKTYK